jgi:hypothetical protein
MQTSSLDSTLKWLSLTTKTFLSHINTISLNLSKRYQKRSTQIGPYSLVQLAYQGKLLKQGIPSQATLVEAYYMGQIDEIALVRSAVEAKLMPSRALINTDYLSAVKTAFLVHNLLHPAKPIQQKSARSLQELKPTEAVRRIEQDYLLERRFFG